jgi:hypothetical protein
MTMRNYLKAAALLTLTLALPIPAAGSVSIAVYAPANIGIASMNYTVQGSRIDIYENWSSSDEGYLAINGLSKDVDYVVFKHITNNSRQNWTCFGVELLDPAGQANDALDPNPDPYYIPPGYTTSNDMDGLSFAQGSNLARTSKVFKTVASDEYTEHRDYLQYRDGTLSGLAGSDLVSFGMRDRQPDQNETFLMAQRPNCNTRPVPPGVPEPSSLLLLGAGLGGWLFMRRRAVVAVRGRE